MSQAIKIELSKEELEIIQGWYSSAAGESASGLEIMPKENWHEPYLSKYEQKCSEAKKILALIAKLGLTLDESSQYFLQKAGIDKP